MEDTMDYIQIGEFLKDLRIANKLTQKEVADILIVAPQTISKWELGTSMPGVDMLQGLSQIYHISVDDIFNCRINEVDQLDQKSKSDSRNVLLFIIYSLLFVIGLVIPFVNYMVIDSRILEYGIESYPFDFVAFTMGIEILFTNWYIILFTIFLPILLLTLFVLDKRKKFLVSISLLAIILLITFQVPIISAPGFMSAEIGLIIHIIYTLLLILSTAISISYFNLDLYRLINTNKKEFISALIMVILTIILPFNYYNHNYYFGESQQILFLFMLFTPILIIYETINGIKSSATVYYFVLGIVLIFSSIVNIFNSNVLMASFIQLIYLLFLVIPNYKQTRFNVNFKKIIQSNFMFVEIVSLIIYLLYYNILKGDLFSGHETIYINTTSVGKYVHLNIILLIFGMVFRIGKIKIMTKVSEFLWIIWVAYFTFRISVDYVFNKWYHLSDGIYLLIPPILIVIYFIFNLINLYRKEKSVDNLKSESLESA